MKSNVLISVCIASIGRPSLLKTLDSLVKCWQINLNQFEVIICDDSIDQKTTELIKDISCWPFKITIVYTGSSNAGIARNACLKQCSHEFIAFIDDDEVASESWLSDYLLNAKNLSADALFGRVDAIYPENTPSWIRAAKPFFKCPGKEGKIITSGTTANVFMRRKPLVDSGVTFPQNTGKSGGEDTIFFANLASKGMRLMAAESSVTYEIVPLDRLSVKSLFKRYMRGGQTYALIYICSKSIYKKLFLFFYTLVKVLTYLFLFSIFFLVIKSNSLKFLLRGAGNLGKLSVLLGSPLLRIY